MLAVSVNHQRRGVGGRLVDWGLERAERDGLPAVLCASVKGRNLYHKKGFRFLCDTKFPPGECDMAMLWEPPGMEGQFRPQILGALPADRRLMNKVIDTAIS